MLVWLLIAHTASDKLEERLRRATVSKQNIVQQRYYKKENFRIVGGAAVQFQHNALPSMLFKNEMSKGTRMRTVYGGSG